MTYSNRQAIVVPQSAIVMHGGQAFITEINAATGIKQDIAVDVGSATATGIQITRGLVAGSLVQLQ